ncbi:SWI/SNF and RSC complexes subunit ssr2 [Phytophthora nicotianae]|uniref:SWI/SNF and RSC complexes subunit ssr2 n=1 Tax=Phytophthora nicotianae TaxID=4792 RepID=A0A0W8CQ09_PHYNI|nr:SWI/SNF and RSC complexes subunit ssr2 [Phytophthora nicotianae]
MATPLDTSASSSAAIAAPSATSAPTASSSPPAPSAAVPTPPTVVEAAQPTDNDPQTDHDDSEGAKAVAVPRCSTWFAMDKINPIEKRMLPEFFADNASKTAEIYLKYRNYMVHAYRQQPGVYLTATACRRNLAGDACSILRVHEFLTHWGLINFHVPPHAMPPSIHSNYALKTAQTTANSDELGPVAMLVAAKKENARRMDTPLACEACGTARGPEDSFFELTTEAKKKFTSNGASNANNATSMTTGANGKAGEGKEVTVGGFALRPGSGICEECYIRGAFPEGYDSSDFILMPTVAKNLSAAAKWTQEETNLLLEAVSSTRANRVKSSENEDEGSCDWNFVASKVGTKTADECLLHFLEMPMLNQSQELGNSIQSLRPFTAGEALNAPVLDLAALVEQVDPLVAKAAAHAAIGAIKRLHTMPAKSSAVKIETASKTDASSTSLEAAVDAVASSAEAAGIASIKSEDVAMADVSTATDSTVEGKKDASVSKEMIAVTEEAANATTVALLATRAQKVAEETDNGPVRDLVNQLLENQLRQMELKMKQLSVLEQSIVAEKEQLAKEKYQLYVDRLAFSKEKLNGRS